MVAVHHVWNNGVEEVLLGNQDLLVCTNVLYIIGLVITKQLGGVGLQWRRQGTHMQDSATIDAFSGLLMRQKWICGRGSEPR